MISNKVLSDGMAFVFYSVNRIFLRPFARERNVCISFYTDYGFLIVDLLIIVKAQSGVTF